MASGLQEKAREFAHGLVLAGLVAAAAGVALPMAGPGEPAAAPEPPTVASPVAIELPETTPEKRPDRVATLRSGETLSDLLQELGLEPAAVAQVADAARPYVNPRQLHPGLQIAAFLEQGVPERFELALRGRGELALARADQVWEPSWRPYERDTRTRVVRGELRDSLDASLATAGAGSELAYAMAEVLQWDLDFTRDLQNGDRFEVLFEEVYLDGDYFGLGSVLALSYTQPRRKLEVFRFGEGESYYDAEGRPLEKMFLRAPLAYSRVTSRFSTKRFHPVLKVNRPHYGVDYGAPKGTPVRVTATGTVVSAGWDGGGGKTIKVRHANDFLTCYLHLSRFADGIRAGTRVHQGEIIGYVGSTGLATAAHLDYRVKQHGSWIDPLSLKSVPAEPISPLARDAFVRQRDAMRLALATGGEFLPPAPENAPEMVRVASAGGTGTPSGRAAKKK
ncbi:MAG: peptidoglycan DD-metalloendopeptidase family protein [Thermoanaerobaculia bacterium]